MSYQGGKYVDIFCAQGPDPLSKLRMSGGLTVSKEFDPVIKGYVIALSGSPATTRIQLPKAERKHLRITNSLLVCQVIIPDGSRTIFEINVLDNNSNKRRLQLSTLYGRVSTTPLQAKIPLTCVPVDTWVWLVIDVSSLLSCVYPGQHLQYINGVSVCGTCKIRRIATIRDHNIGELPSSWQPPPSVPSLEFILFNDCQIGKRPVGVSKEQKQQQPMHVAFGEKIHVPGHVLKSRPHSDTSKRPKPIPSKSSHHIPIITQEIEIIPNKIESPVLVPDNSIPVPDNPIPIQDNLIPVLSSQTEPRVTSPLQSEYSYSSSPTSFEYRSLPHSAQGNRYTASNNTIKNGLKERGAQPEEDFISLMNDNEGYDWQKYQTINTSSSSNSGSDDEDHTHQLPLTIPLAGNSLLASTGFDTLKNKLQALEDSRNDTLDIDRMGGANSPTDNVTMATDEEEKVELVYDKDLNCFYNPQTNKYYKLT